MPLRHLEDVTTSHGGNGEKQLDVTFLDKTAGWMSLHPWLDVSHIVGTAPANTGQEGTCAQKGQLLLGGLLQTLGKHV